MAAQVLIPSGSLLHIPALLAWDTCLSARASLELIFCSVLCISVSCRFIHSFISVRPGYHNHFPVVVAFLSQTLWEENWTYCRNGGGRLSLALVPNGYNVMRFAVSLTLLWRGWRRGRTSPSETEVPAKNTSIRVSPRQSGWVLHHLRYWRNYASFHVLHYFI